MRCDCLAKMWRELDGEALMFAPELSGGGADRFSAADVRGEEAGPAEAGDHFSDVLSFLREEAMSARGSISLLEALTTVADALRGQGLEERPEVRRALHKVDGRIHELQEVLARERARLRRIRRCARCSGFCLELVCGGCRGFVPWELRVEFARALDDGGREAVAVEARAWMRAREAGRLPVAGSSGRPAGPGRIRRDGTLPGKLQKMGTPAARRALPKRGTVLERRAA